MILSPWRALFHAYLLNNKHLVDETQDLGYLSAVSQHLDLAPREATLAHFYSSLT